MLVSLLLRCSRHLVKFARRMGPAAAAPAAVGSARQVKEATPAAVRAWTAPHIEVRGVETDGHLVVRVTGEAVLATARALEAGLLPLAARRPRLVTLDLSDLGFISSLAMGILVAYRHAVIRTGGQFRLAPDLQPAVREALRRARLTHLFASVDPAPPARQAARDLATAPSS